MHAGKPTVWEYSKNIESNANSQALTIEKGEGIKSLGCTVCSCA